MVEKTEIEVLICGAGIAGLTLAIDLARRGVAFRLIDKLDGPFPGSRGKGVQPRSQEVFEDLGIIDRIVAVGGTYPPQHEYRSDGSYKESLVMASRGPTPAEPYHVTLLVPQFLAEGVMRERLAELGHQPQFGCELRSFEQDDNGVTVRIANRTDEEVLRVRYLVGTDGGHSVVRRTLNIGFPGETLDVRAVVADVVLSGLRRDIWHRFTEGSITLCPLPGTDLFQLQAPIPLEGDINLSAQGLSDMVAERTGRDDIRIASVAWASSFVMSARLADRYRIGRVFLAGDAAHVHPPTGGQGLNTSLQDSYNLGWKLASVLQGAPDSLLDTYEEERRPVAAQMLGLATKLLDAAKRGVMRRGREVYQLDLGYPMSSLALKQPKLGGIKWMARIFLTRFKRTLLTGERAPDAPIRSAAGQPTRLFELFRGPHWTLIGYHVDKTDAVAPRPNLHIHTIGLHGDIADDRHHFRDIYGIAAGNWVLVRPDGYIAAITSNNDNSALECYMSKVGLTLREEMPL